MKPVYILVGIVLLVSGVILFWAVYKQLSEDFQVRKNGKRCDGEITGVYASKSKGIGNSCYLMVRIPESDNELHSVRSKYYLLRNAAKQVGQPIVVLYNPDFPDKCTFGGMHAALFNGAIFMVLAAFLAVAGAYAISMGLN